VIILAVIGGVVVLVVVIIVIVCCRRRANPRGFKSATNDKSSRLKESLKTINGIGAEY